MERVLCGNESNLTFVGINCPGCNAAIGQNHEYGCAVEECPACGKRILHCSCKALNTYHAVMMASAVEKQITGRAEVLRTMAEGSKRLDATYYEEGVMQWIIDDVTERDPAAKKYLESFLAEMGFRKTGELYAVDAETISENLGIPVNEAHEALQNLQEESFELNQLKPSSKMH